MHKNNLKILLLQLRKDEAMREHERLHMIRSSGLQDAQFRVIDGLCEPLPNTLRGHHFFIIGGSGDFSIFDDLPFKDDLAKLLREARVKNIPTLGACWGAQFMAQIFGGEVITDKKNEEVGTMRLKLTEAARRDPIFCDFPEEFMAQLGHHERVSRLPAGAVCLAGSEKCPIQAFAWPGTAIYGLQMHPELGKKELIERVLHYRSGYAADPQIFDSIIAGVQESPLTENMVRLFIDRVVLPRFAKIPANVI